MNTEFENSKQIRLDLADNGWLVWRNNVGQCVDMEGNHIRYGLANESKQMNKHIKSSDLVGVRPVVITQDMVGKFIGQFVAIEVKRSGWKFKATAREVAQARYHKLVNDKGGYSTFATSVDDIVTLK